MPPGIISISLSYMEEQWCTTAIVPRSYLSQPKGQLYQVIDKEEEKKVPGMIG